MAEQHTRRMHSLLQTHVTALQQGDGAAASRAHKTLMDEAAGGGVRVAKPLPPATLDACAALLEEYGPAGGSTAVDIVSAVTEAAAADGGQYAAADLLTHARFAR